jgi:hypothetical protein
MLNHVLCNEPPLVLKFPLPANSTQLSRVYRYDNNSNCRHPRKSQHH